ncbi:hypothetical protein GL2_36160 [Microbulbifer sp. GL-2]|nr:hypothetical protein GL2_36160 [Microbulbifer sp. GL-2]
MGYFLSGGLHISTRESLQRHKERRRAEKELVAVKFIPPMDEPVDKCNCPPEECSYKNP